MVEIEGKRGRELPLLLMPDIKEAMEILVKKRRSQHQSKQQVFLYTPVRGLNSSHSPQGLSDKTM